MLRTPVFLYYNIVLGVKHNKFKTSIMKQITIDLTLSTAREWYKGGNEYLRKMALTAYSIEDLTGWPTTLEDAAKSIL
jgi:hypothetical protein